MSGKESIDVCFIEDNLIIRDCCIEKLESKKLSCVGGESLSDFERLLRSYDPRLLLLDYSFIGGDFHDAMDMVKFYDRSHLPVVLFSGMDRVADAEEYGAKFIQKPECPVDYIYYKLRGN